MMKIQSHQVTVFNSFCIHFTTLHHSSTRRKDLTLSSQRRFWQPLIEERSSDSDRGDLTQTIIIIVGFVAVATAVIGWISSALFGSGADTSKCITSYGQGVFHNTPQECYNDHSFEAEKRIQCDVIARYDRFKDPSCGLSLAS